MSIGLAEVLEFLYLWVVVFAVMMAALKLKRVSDDSENKLWLSIGFTVGLVIALSTVGPVVSALLGA